MIMRIATALVLSCLMLMSGTAAAIAEGAPAPALHGTLFDGTHFSLEDYAGKVVVLNFWATWCAPCREEMPALDAYYRRHRSEGLEVVAISMDNPKDEAKARDMMQAYAFSAAFGRELSLKAYGRIWRLPLTFVIDRQGVLRKDGWTGDPLLDAVTLEKVVTPLLRERMNAASSAPLRAFAARATE
jgi:cytochrome c biogenesis protein CcmG, thiol:disulfide interchange protein DsbE